MPTYVQWQESAKPTKQRIYVVVGEDAALRADAIDYAVRLIDPSERVSLNVGSGEGDASSARVWDAVLTRPLAGSGTRMVVVHHADRIRSWAPLHQFIKGTASFPDIVVVLVLDRVELGTRQRVQKMGVPGVASWETVLSEWEQWVKDYGKASIVTCRPLSIDPADFGKLSPAARWLCARLPVTQRQAEYLWRRVGGDSILARDTVRSLRVLGLVDATGLPGSEFSGLVDLVVGAHGPEDLVDQLLFDRKAEAFASVAGQGFSQAEWGKILGLLSQRLDWLGPLHEALATDEQLDQVMRRLNIHRKWILYYAHRMDPKHNIARKYDAAKVSRSRILIADFDSRLNRALGVPEGFGEAFVASW